MVEESPETLGEPLDEPLDELPQPSQIGAQPYRYLKFEQLHELLPENWYDVPNTLCWVCQSKGKKKHTQLYKRARILSPCEEEKDRVTVQYPRGATYRVRKKYLMPVLEHHTNVILVTSETTDYRRTAKVQTLKEDHFLEIGCDFGILVDMVDAASSTGVDKSEESIKIAREKYPMHKFLLEDVFDETLDFIPQQPLVVAIDINGNRALPAVLQCIQHSMDKWSPRLMVVKSRELYAAMSKDDTVNTNSSE